MCAFLDIVSRERILVIHYSIVCGLYSSLKASMRLKVEVKVKPIVLGYEYRG